MENFHTHEHTHTHTRIRLHSACSVYRLADKVRHEGAETHRMRVYKCVTMGIENKCPSTYAASASWVYS